MYESPSGTSNTLVAADLKDFADLAEPTQDRLIRSAYRTVADIAPPPTSGQDPAFMEGYRLAAQDAEVAVIDFLITTQGGVLKSSTISQAISETYSGIDAIETIVRGAMRGYLGTTLNSVPVVTVSRVDISSVPVFDYWSR